MSSSEKSRGRLISKKKAFQFIGMDAADEFPEPLSEIALGEEVSPAAASGGGDEGRLKSSGSWKGTNESQAPGELIQKQAAMISKNVWRGVLIDTF
ncbi:MAG: hypothetical protein WC859_03735 [Elusimicrobiota bacterium]|jgi:hypothetical protein